MIEGVLQFRKEACLVHELGGLQTAETPAERIFIEVSDAEEEGEGHVGADYRRRLQQPFVLRGKSIDARGKDRLDGRRYPDCVEPLHEPVGAAGAGQRPYLDKRSHALLEEQRVALGALYQ